MVVASVVLACAAALVAWGGAAVTAATGWVTDLQLIPLLLSAMGTAVAAWLVVTTLFGRIYCSTVCPLGAVQDVAARLRRPTRRTLLRRPYHYVPPLSALRHLLLALAALTPLLGFPLLLQLLDPYDAFCRIASELGAPPLRWLAGHPAAWGAATGIAVALLSLLPVALLPLWRGRLLCNTICPVGTLLGLFSRWSLWHIEIDTDLCTGCNMCEHVCKSQCINPQDHSVDGSRCVLCFNCLDACPCRAIAYTSRRKQLATPLMQSAEPTACSAPSKNAK